MCHDDSLATRTLGQFSARKLRSRLDDLAAIQNLCLAQRLPGRFHPLTGDLSGAFALDLHRGHRLVFEPASDPVPKRPDGTLDSANVTDVRIIFIGDYHD